MRYSICGVFCALTFLTFNFFAQSQFQLTIGGTNNEFAYSMVQTADGGFASAGYTNSFGAGNYDCYIVKLDAGGTLQWSRTVGGDNNDVANSIIQTADGGYAVAGHTYSFGAGSADFYIVKLDANGTVQWSKTAGGDSIDVAYSIKQTSDNGFIAAGYTRSFGAGYYDIYIVKLDSSGDYQWSKTVGTTLGEQGTSIIITSDGGYALAGYGGTTTTNSIDYYILKLDANGTPQWSTTVGGTAHDYAWSIIQTVDGGYAATGYCQGFGAGASDMYVVKLSSAGSVQWTRTIGGTGSDFGWSIIQNPDGSYIVAGYTNSFGAGGADAYIVKLSASGLLQWSKTIGAANNDVADKIIQSSDGGYIAAGSTFTILGGGYTLADMYIVKFDGNWKTCGNNRSQKSKSGSGGIIGNENRSVTSPIPVVTSPVPVVNSGGTVTMICSRSSNGPLSENGTSGNTQNPFQFSLNQNYPNPFNPTTNLRFEISDMRFIKLKIYDAMGREVNTLINEQLMPGIYEVSWDASNYPSGVYFYKITAEDASSPQANPLSITRKMILVK